jgi:hypothetical protein
MHRTKSHLAAHFALFVLTVGCKGAPTPRAADTLAARSVAAGVVDSILPPEESLRRFRENLPAVSTLEHAESNRDSLVRRFVRAVERNDTTTLRAIVITRAEFAYLYFPTSSHARPPAQQPPALVWFLQSQASEKGVSRALNRFGGQALDARGYTCASPPRVEGGNTIWDDCRLHVRANGDTSSIRLFGGVIERDGRFKLLSYSNDL